MKLEKEFIPLSNSNRPGTIINPSYITIHETANTSVGANAQMHSSYVKGVNAQNRQVSWHITVDDAQAIQHLPLNEMGWHAGLLGNKQSIGIEICVNQDGNFEEAKKNAISIIRHLMEELRIDIASVVSHKHWTGKNCPANLLSTWKEFTEDIIKDVSSPDIIRMLEVKAESLWIYDKPDWNSRHKTVNKGEVFTIKEDLMVNGSKMYQLKSGLFITANVKYVTTWSK
ncbi:N-acetylmuramoyl-L-alanine amidase [Shouchella miscanthi]|uniref:N-acetylmuramoyl-L-alanine amidase n=1 Tax=Shouchella miscanthi TaxID=2598861 RepID=A0ABU6NLY5_9BACI|nr:N-acetylmuramoyl-L-alanine amidase [Shouchella miscanthi]MED4128494.1 N-acetylmuramoyl-L-alanine amidase [Shouchella miscanthi]